MLSNFKINYLGQLFIDLKSTLSLLLITSWASRICSGFLLSALSICLFVSLSLLSMFSLYLIPLSHPSIPSFYPIPLSLPSLSPLCLSPLFLYLSQT
jgi:hypothetical protein